MDSWPKVATAASPLLVGWGVLAVTPLIAEAYFEKLGTGPTVPNVVMFPPGESDMRSSVLALLLVIAMAMIGAAIADVAKATSRSRATWLPIVLCQISFVLDGLRAFSPDWWTYLLSVIGVIELHPLSWMEPVPLSGAPWPWFSALLTAVVAGFFVWVNRPSRVPTV